MQHEPGRISSEYLRTPVSIIESLPPSSCEVIRKHPNLREDVLPFSFVFEQCNTARRLRHRQRLLAQRQPASPTNDCESAAAGERQLVRHFFSMFFAEGRQLRAGSRWR